MCKQCRIKQNWLHAKVSVYFSPETGLQERAAELNHKWLDSSQLLFQWDLGVLHNHLVLYGNTHIGPTNISLQSVSTTEFHEYVENIEKGKKKNHYRGGWCIVN